MLLILRKVKRPMVDDAVDDAVAFEVDRKGAVVPTGDRRLADRGMFVVGQPEAFQHCALASPARG